MDEECDECPTCCGTGRYVYDSTTMGKGGIGGQMSTEGPCPGTRHRVDWSDCPVVLRELGGKVLSMSFINEADSPQRRDDVILSRLLFEARESVEMLADIVEGQEGKPATHQRDLVARIDDYRFESGWSPDGFGGE